MDMLCHKKGGNRGDFLGRVPHFSFQTSTTAVAGSTPFGFLFYDKTNGRWTEDQKNRGEKKLEKEYIEGDAIHSDGKCKKIANLERYWTTYNNAQRYWRTNPFVLPFSYRV